jgi:hypothetical protein
MLTTSLPLSDVELRAGQIRLAVICQSCPVYSRHPDCCMLKDLAQLRPADQIDFIESLPVDDLKFALNYHDACMAHETEKVLRGLDAK